MKTIVAVFFLCFVLAVNAAPRIVGGRDAPEGKYPYQVSLRAPSSHRCGGSIINKRYILTAAHCVTGVSASSMRVYVGANQLDSEDAEVYRAESIVYHEQYSAVRFVNDVGLIRVDRDIEFNEKVQPISLPNEDFTKVDYTAVVTGWGRLSAGGRIPNNLQEIDLKVISQKDCRDQMTTQITESHICTLTQVGEGVCNGDSGGPLVSDGVQIGIVSFGYPCARGRPDAYTRVYTFLDWINKNIAKK